MHTSVTVTVTAEADGKVISSITQSYPRFAMARRGFRDRFRFRAIVPCLRGRDLVDLEVTVRGRVGAR